MSAEAARSPLTRLRGRARGADASVIAWDLPDRGGPLVAVAGLCGGAGASTVAYLLAASAAGDPGAATERAPVLACDAGDATAGLALYAGRRSPRSLTETAVELAQGRAPGAGLFAVSDGGLRLITGGPRAGAAELGGAGAADIGSADIGSADAGSADAGSALRRLVGDARRAHCLTVVDCGTLATPAQRIALSMASDCLWVLPASGAGLRRCADGLRDAPATGARETVVARREHGSGRAPVRRIAQLADARGAPLVLMPQVPELTGGTAAAALQVGQVTLQALAARLRR